MMRSLIFSRGAIATPLKLNCIRFNSISVGKRSFPLDLPPEFEFTSHSITYSNGHRTIPDRTTKTIPVQNPATQETLQYIECASPETISSSITDAQRIFTSGVWSQATASRRLHVLSEIAHLLRKHAKELAARNHLAGQR
jgi:hypothetical protein